MYFSKRVTAIQVIVPSIREEKTHLLIFGFLQFMHCWKRFRFPIQFHGSKVNVEAKHWQIMKLESTKLFTWLDSDWKTTGRKYRYELQTAFCQLQNAMVKYSINDDDDEEAEEHDDSDDTLAGCRIQLGFSNTPKMWRSILYATNQINQHLYSQWLWTGSKFVSQKNFRDAARRHLHAGKYPASVFSTSSARLFGPGHGPWLVCM